MPPASMAISMLLFMRMNKTAAGLVFLGGAGHSTGGGGLAGVRDRQPGWADIKPGAIMVKVVSWGILSRMDELR